MGKRGVKLKKRKKVGIAVAVIIALILAPTFLDPRNPEDYIDVDSSNKEEIISDQVTEEMLGKESGRENIVGISNKDIFEVSKQKPSKVRNDSTGNWRLTKLSKICNIEEYALSYYKNSFESSNEVHAIVNFANKTTTRINDLGSFLSISIMEYVDNEEHDANMLFSGMVLKEYFVYKDNGEIEEIKEY